MTTANLRRCIRRRAGHKTPLFAIYLNGVLAREVRPSADRAALEAIAAAWNAGNPAPTSTAWSYRVAALKS